MAGDTLLVAIATIAVAIAGFTAVTSTLSPPGGAWSPQMRLRQRAIVTTSFNVVFESLVPLIAFAWLGDERSAIVVASLGVAIYATGVVLYRGRQFLRTGGFRSPAVLIMFTAGPVATLLFWANVAVGSLALFALALCIQLSIAVVSFYSLVSAASG